MGALRRCTLPRCCNRPERFAHTHCCVLLFMPKRGSADSSRSALFHECARGLFAHPFFVMRCIAVRVFLSSRSARTTNTCSCSTTTKVRLSMAQAWHEHGRAHNRPSSLPLSARCCRPHFSGLVLLVSRSCFVQTAIAVSMRSSLLRFQKMQRWDDRTRNEGPAPRPHCSSQSSALSQLKLRARSLSLSPPVFFRRKLLTFKSPSHCF